MKKSNVSKWIEHVVKRELYGNATTKDVLLLLETLKKEIEYLLSKEKNIRSKQQYREVLEQLKELLSTYKKNYSDILQEQIGIISTTESKWLTNFMKSVGKDIVVPATILSSLKFSPIAAQTDYQRLVESSSDRIYLNVDTALRNGLLFGRETNIEGVSKKIDTEMNNTKLDVEAFNTTVFSMTDYLLFKKNKEKMVYSAILDSKTCLVCASYDGQTFAYQDAPIPPMHYNCRCTLIPESIIDDDIPTFAEWLENQDEDIKKETLGKGRYELYKQGFSMDKFVNNGNIIPLKELKS